MSKVIMFSRYYPTYHPKKGKPTFFAEKLLTQLRVNYFHKDYLEMLISLNEGKEELCKEFYRSFWDLETDINQNLAKSHTIRNGFRFKAGEKFSPKIWTAKPYQSKQLFIYPDIEVKKTWAFEKSRVDGFQMPQAQATTHAAMIAKNDGILLDDFIAWFNKPFIGQIICWNEAVSY